MRTSVSIPTFLKLMGIMGPEPGEIARNVEGDPQAGKSMITHEDLSSLGAFFRVRGGTKEKGVT